MAIQTVPGSEMVNSQAMAVKADAGALGAAGAARMRVAGQFGSIGSAISEVADHVVEFKQKVQAGKDAGIIAEASDLMSKSKHEFEQSLQNDPDSEKWGQKWHENYVKNKNEFLSNERISPNLKKQLSIGFDHWGRAGALDVDTIANKQQIGRATKSITNAMDEHAKSGTPESMQAIENLGQMMKDRGLAFPEEADRLVKENKNKAAAYSADRLIENNPAGGIKFINGKDSEGNYLNLPELDPHQREVFLGRARIAESTFHKENLATIVNRFDIGDPVSKKELKGMVQRNQISPTALNSLIKMGTVEAAKKSTTLHDNLKSSLIDAVANGASKDEMLLLRNKISDNSPLLLPADRNSLLSSIDSTIKLGEKQAATAQGVIKRSALNSMKADFELGAMLPSVLEMKSGERFFSRDVPTGGLIPEKEGQSLAEWKVNHGQDKMTVAENQKHYDQAVLKLEQFMKDKPNATEDEVDAYRQTLSAPWVLAKTKKILSGFTELKAKEAMPIAPVAAEIGQKNTFQVGRFSVTTE